MNMNSINTAAQAANPFDPNSADDSSPSSGSTAGSSGANPEVTQNQFLQLLVTQLKNQDPLNPTNSDQFMSELAQFSSLQEVIGIHQDLNALLQADNVTVPNSSGK